MILTIEAKDFADLKNQLVDFLRDMKIEVEINSQESKRSPKTQKRKKEVTPLEDSNKDETQSLTDEELKEELEIITPSVDLEEVTEVPSAPSKDQVIDIIKEVNSKLGTVKAREILMRFGAQRLSEVTEDKFIELIRVCSEELSK